MRICYTNLTCANPSLGTTDPSSLNHYIEQVLANEWHSLAELDALKAGAIAIRTFAYRELGCGAYTGKNLTETGTPPIISRVLDNRSQAFKLVYPDGTTHQNDITTNHISARSQTDNVFLYRTDSTFACAKYNANTRNPTKACSSSDCPQVPDQETLTSTIDPVDRNNLPETEFKPQVGMSQDGTVAWGIGPAGWDYRQMLSHYYRKVQIGSQNNDYRWVWLNVGNEISFTGFWGDQYNKVAVLTPGLLTPSQLVQVPVKIQNTGDVTWVAGGASAVKLSYHWYDSQGTTIVVWNGEQTNLSADVLPGGVISLQAQLRAPAQPGVYTLKWDMLRGTAWFSATPNLWPTHNASGVLVLQQIRKAFLPHIINPVAVQ